MAIFRIKHNDFEKTFVSNMIDTLDANEWKDTLRLNEPGWDNRYDYEAKILYNIITECNAKSILEIGSGPGVLSQKIQNLLPNPIEYHLIDKPLAKKYFEDNNFIGKFFIKDISIDLDTSGLNSLYDLIIINDTLEHLLAPSNIVNKISSLMNEHSTLFVSVPNWRMAHQFLYRGLWDYDNFIYFMYIHGIEMDSVYPSCLLTPDYPRIDSEETMPEELRRSWNWYFVMKKRKEKKI
ncbi:MAG TPA: methyltransferase domain-containing protein [Bacteroidales bacterium]|nr:methyltransferase domain-containing protein [Bacteroidales bacterium]